MRVEKIESFNKENLKELKKAINNSLGLIGRTFGIEIKLGSVSYGEYNFTGKLEANLESKDGEIFTKEAVAYKKYCTTYGLEPDWLGKEFKYKTKTYKVIGLSPSARTYPVICSSGDSTYKFPIETIQFSLQKAS